MATQQRLDYIQPLKFFRAVHILEIFYPFRKLIDFMFQDLIKKKRQNYYSMVVLISAALLGGHICACIWVFIGSLDGGWLNVL